MGTVTGLTAARMLEIENESVVGGSIVGANLILTRHDGTTIDAGEVKGEPGTDGITPIFFAESTTAVDIAISTPTFVLDPAMPLPFAIATIVKAASLANPNNYVLGFVTEADTVSVTIDVRETGGAGNYADWVLTLAGFKGPPGDMNAADAGGDLVGQYPNPQLAPQLSQALVPTGAIFPTFSTVEPEGYKFLNGQEVSRTTEAALFDMFGTIGGEGNGIDTFNLPDLSDIVIMGASATKDLWSQGGSSTITILDENLPPHVHNMNHTHTIKTKTSAGSSPVVVASGTTSPGGVTNLPSVNDFVGDTGNGPGLSTPVDITPPYIALNYLIKT